MNVFNMTIQNICCDAPHPCLVRPGMVPSYSVSSDDIDDMWQDIRVGASGLFPGPVVDGGRRAWDHNPNSRRSSAQRWYAGFEGRDLNAKERTRKSCRKGRWSSKACASWPGTRQIWRCAATS